MAINLAGRLLYNPICKPRKKESMLMLEWIFSCRAVNADTSPATTQYSTLSSNSGPRLSVCRLLSTQTGLNDPPHPIRSCFLHMSLVGACGPSPDKPSPRLVETRAQPTSTADRSTAPLSSRSTVARSAWLQSCLVRLSRHPPSHPSCSTETQPRDGSRLGSALAATVGQIDDWHFKCWGLCPYGSVRHACSLA